MTKRARTLLAIVVVELVLAGIWLVLARMGATHVAMSRIGVAEPEFQATLGQAMGAAMGGFLGLGLLAFFIAAKRDREG